MADLSRPTQMLAAVTLCLLAITADAACPFKHLNAPHDSSRPASFDSAAVEAVNWKVTQHT